LEFHGDGKKEPSCDSTIVTAKLGVTFVRIVLSPTPGLSPTVWTT